MTPRKLNEKVDPLEAKPDEPEKLIHEERAEVRNVSPKGKFPDKTTPIKIHEGTIPDLTHIRRIGLLAIDKTSLIDDHLGTGDPSCGVMANGHKRVFRGTV